MGDVPSLQSRAGWASFLQLLSLADGIVVLRLSDSAEYDAEGYLTQSEFLSEVYEIVDSRPMFIVSVCKGPIRASMTTFLGISTVVLASKEATFGFPAQQADKVNPMAEVAFKKRLTECVYRRLTLV